MRIMMLVASALAYFINSAVVKAKLRQRRQNELRASPDFAGMLTSIISMAMTYVISYLVVPT